MKGTNSEPLIQNDAVPLGELLQKLNDASSSTMSQSLQDSTMKSLESEANARAVILGTLLSPQHTKTLQTVFDNPSVEIFDTETKDKLVEISNNSDVRRRVEVLTKFIINKLQEDTEIVDQVQSEKLLQTYRLLLDGFNLEELRTLCFEMSVEIDDLPAIGRADKARELVKLMRRQGRVDALLEQIKIYRPHLNVESIQNIESTQPAIDIAPLAKLMNDINTSPLAINFIEAQHPSESLPVLCEMLIRSW